MALSAKGAIVKLVPDFIRPRWRGILMWLGIGFGLIAITLWLLGIATMSEARRIARDNPSVWMSPVHLSNSSISNALGKRLSYLGYEFEVPWTDIDNEHTKLVGSWQVIAFDSKRVIVLRTRPAKEEVKFFSGGGKRDALKSRLIWGGEALVSDYAFNKAALETTPANVTPFALRPQARELGLLVLKSTLFAVNGKPDRVFLITTKDFQGFQYGYPQARPRMIVDSLYADTGGLDLEFHNSKSGPAITQEEINRVVQTVRPARR
jgi:hypothetical protein